jgi:hypothetical protein
MKAKKEHVDKELMVIKLFANNYARDLLFMTYGTFKKYENHCLYDPHCVLRARG